MSHGILAARPLSRNDVSHLATLIEANLLQFESNPTLSRIRYLETLDLLIRLGFDAATAYGALDTYEIRLRCFFRFHPARKPSKLFKAFSTITADMINASAYYFGKVNLPVGHAQFKGLAKEVRDDMIINLGDKAQLIHRLFKPIVD